MRGGLTSPNPIPAITGEPQSCDNPAVCPQRLGRSRLFFNPFTISLLCLAAAVALWGYGYKLSLYHRHPDKTSANAVAKLWVKERSQATAGSSSRGLSDRDQEFSAQPAVLCAVAPNRLITADDGRTLPPSRVQIAFDLFSRPPPSTSSL